MNSHVPCSVAVRPLLIVACVLAFAAPIGLSARARTTPAQRSARRPSQRGSRSSPSTCAATSCLTRKPAAAPPSGPSPGWRFLRRAAPTEQGDYAPDLRTCLDQVLKAADAKTGAIAGRGGSFQMYDHGFATLFLAEVYAKQPAGERKDEVGRVLERAVALIAKAQNPREVALHAQAVRRRRLRRCLPDRCVPPRSVRGSSSRRARSTGGRLPPQVPERRRWIPIHGQHRQQPPAGLPDLLRVRPRWRAPRAPTARMRLGR